jgi:hypothetical protein
VLPEHVSAVTDNYPRTSVMSYPSCGEVAYSDGTKWIQQIPYRCSRKTYPPSLKVG